MSTTTFAEFYSILSTSLQRKLLYHRTTILTSVFFNFIKILCKKHAPRRVHVQNHILFS